MTDGGTFNGRTVTGLGISKVADLYYEAQTNLLTSGSNYQDLYDALTQAAINLGYSAADRQEIEDALKSVEMDTRPCAPDPDEVALCPANQTANSIWFDDLENTGSGNWSAQASTGTNRFFYPQIPNAYSFDATYANSGDTNFWGYAQPALSDFHIRMNVNVAVPANAYLLFYHDWAFEDSSESGTPYDGGVVEYSTNNGGAWNDAAGLFVHNGYNGTISTSSDNPLEGRNAFVRESRGYTNSKLNLASLAGQNVRFRFRIGTDSGGGAYGWFIDDIRVYTCGTASPSDIYNYLPIVVRSLPTATATSPAPTIANGNFESGPAVWSQSSSHGWPVIVDNSSFPPGVTAHGGAWAAWLGGGNNEISWIQQQVTVPPAMPYLAYWRWIASSDGCGYDYARLVVNGGDVELTDLCAPANTGGWQHHAVYLGAYAGQSITLQLRVETSLLDSSSLLVDDMTFQASPAALGEQSGIDGAGDVGAITRPGEPAG
jgi:hypothetical protein